MTINKNPYRILAISSDTWFADSFHGLWVDLKVGKIDLIDLDTACIKLQDQSQNNKFGKPVWYSNSFTEYS